jgi:hypothetical protein
MEELLSQIIPILVTCIVGILAVVIKSVGDVAKEYLEAKKEEAIARIGKEEYERRITTALDIWGIVEEHFRLNDLVAHTIDDKANMFNDLLLERIPSLTQADLDYLRQTIAGQVNRGKEVVLPSADPLPEEVLQ